MKEELPEKPNIVPSRFVLAIKSVDGEEVLKARYVLSGHMERDKRSFDHNATTLKQSSIRMLVALATILSFNLWSMEINQAYLQSAEKLQRKVFVRPDALQLDNEQFLQVVKPPYGLSDAVDYWVETLSEHHKKELKMELATGDFSFLFKRVTDRLVGLSGSYVDEILRAGDKKFEEDSSKPLPRRLTQNPSRRFHSIYRDAGQRDARRELSRKRPTFRSSSFYLVLQRSMTSGLFVLR